MPLPRAGLAKRGRAMPRNVTWCPRTGAKGGGGAGVLCSLVRSIGGVELERGGGTGCGWKKEVVFFPEAAGGVILAS